MPNYSYRGEEATRYHQRSLIPWRIFQAQDAPVFIVCIEQDQWLRFVDFMGNPEWAELDLFVDQASRAENQDLVHTFVQEFVSGWRAEELFHAAQKYRVCMAPILDMAQISRKPHLLDRNFFKTVREASGDEYQLMASAVLSVLLV